MQIKRAIGSRRTFRFLLPHRPVEPEKIQKMLEAARLASFWGNVQALRAIVVFRDQVSDEVMNSLFAPVMGWQIKQAPVVIVWYLDWSALDEQGDRLRELVEARAIGVDKDTSMRYLNETLIPFFEKVMPLIKQSGITYIDCGQGIAQATLVAIDEGLGTACLGSTNHDKIKDNLGLPEHTEVLLLMPVGYPAESWDGGGQRPRLPFERMYHLNTYGDPFPREQSVIEELRRDRLLQDPSPLPWREAELQYLQKALDIPDI